MVDTTENTPLLRPLDPEPIEQDPHNASSMNTADPSLGLVTALTCLSLALSVLVIAFDRTVSLLDQSHGSGSYYMPYEVEMAITALCIIGLCTILISFLNLVRVYYHRQTLWLWLNLLVDLCTAFYSLAFSVQGLLANALYVCDPANQDCRFARQMQIFEYLTLSLGLALGLIHLALFLIRCALAFRTQFWRGFQFQRWKLPAGQVTLEVTIKFLRQESQRGDGEQSRST